jgi:hypothetical protein
MKTVGIPEFTRDCPTAWDLRLRRSRFAGNASSRQDVLLVSTTITLEVSGFTQFRPYCPLCLKFGKNWIWQISNWGSGNQVIRDAISNESIFGIWKTGNWRIMDRERRALVRGRYIRARVSGHDMILRNQHV